MTEGALIWFVLYGVATLLFFGIATVVAIRGIGEMKDLLKR
jgi:hypothetical protein